jgi:membrane-associated phospholipid phosphatase
LQVLKVVDHDASGIASVDCRLAAKRLWATALVLAVLAGAALAIDLPVAQWVKAGGLPGEVRRVVRLSEVFGWGGTVTLIVITAAVLDPRGWRVLVSLAASSLGAGLLVDGLKLLVARTRPSASGEITTALATFVGWLPVWQTHDPTLRGHSIQSFPSAHAATAAGLASALGMLYPRGRWLFAGFAFMAMLQRVDAQAHYCSDVLAGAAVGCCVAAAVQSSRFRVQS